MAVTCMPQRRDPSISDDFNSLLLIMSECVHNFLSQHPAQITIMHTISHVHMKRVTHRVGQDFNALLIS